MTKESKIKSTQKLIEALRGFDNDYLADVFRPWDCCTQNWHDTRTVLLRFESNDLLISFDKPGAIFEIGAVDTNAFVGIDACMAADEECCLCWRRASAYQELVGTKKAGNSLLWCFLRDELGDDVELFGDLLKR